MTANRRRFHRITTVALLALALVVWLVERFIWDDIKAVGAWAGRRQWVRHAEVALAALPPYAALACFLIPIILILPFKLAALTLMAGGHWLAGLFVLLAAKLSGTLVVARIWHSVSPALLTLGWFARMHGQILRWRQALVAALESIPLWRRLLALKQLIHHLAVSAGQRLNRLAGRVGVTAFDVARRWIARRMAPVNRAR